MKLLIVLLALFVATAKGDAEASAAAEAKPDPQTGLVINPGYGLYSYPGYGVGYSIAKDIDDDDARVIPLNAYSPYWYGNDYLNPALAYGHGYGAIPDLPYPFLRPLNFNTLDNEIPLGYDGRVQVVGVPYIRRVDYPYPHLQQAISYKRIPVHAYQPVVESTHRPVIRGYKAGIHSRLRPVSENYETGTRKGLSVNPALVKHSSYSVLEQKPGAAPHISAEYR